MGALLRFLPGLGPAVTALLNPWILLAAIAVIAGAFLAGMHEQTIRFEAAAKTAQDDAIETAVKFQADQRAQNTALSNSLNRERTARENDRRTFKSKLAAAPAKSLTEVHCPAGTSAPAPGGKASPGPAAAPVVDGGSCRISTDGVRLWNTGLALSLNLADRGQFAHAADAGAGPVEISDAIANVGANAAILGECRDRELGWQVKACTNKWWTGEPCAERLREFEGRK